MSWIDESGRPIRLGARLTTPGGEGVIYELATDSTKLAKIYHQLPGVQKVSKLKHLRTVASKSLLDISAWPVSLLFDANKRHVVGGFLMPLVKGKEIHSLYGPHDRYSEFPQAAWDFLIHAAKNSAAAFEALHEHGVVMADVNEKNLLITREGFVRLIDCDSYQVTSATSIFHCDVGVPLWTAPELQGRDYRGLARSQNHDRFGLAVLIFQLLFMGRHPFAGVPDRPYQFELEQAIGHYLFAFTPKTRSLGIRPPPHALPLTALPGSLVQLFERAFLRGSEKDGARPSGREWYQALDFLEKNLRGCSRDPGHRYSAHLGRCPWCEIYDAGGPNFFISVFVHVAPTVGATNVAVYWSAIQQITPRLLRAKAAAVLTASKPTGTPLPQGVSKTCQTFYLGLVVLLSSVALFFVVGCWAVIGVAIGWGLLSEGRRASEFSAEVNRRRTALEQLKREYERSVQEAQRIADDYPRRFSKRKSDLQNAYNRFLQLDDEKRQEIQKLEAKKRELQLNEFLDRVLIRDDDIPEIGARRKQTLAAYGFESALDISRSMGVPGFGPHLTSILLDWRRKCEGRFRYNPAAPLPQKELHELNLRIASLRQSLEVELRSGPQNLNELGVTAERKLRECESRTISLAQRVGQAEADVAVCN